MSAERTRTGMARSNAIGGYDGCARRAARATRAQGSASVEYVLVTAAIVGALFLPIAPSDVSVVDHVLEAFKRFQENSTYLLSLP